ncbi:MAG: rRNA pseudouridine synthase [Burkholderiaceae bacterium]|nr:rRNA pseudouridine synthase [Burkholderiaceae bacterium]
MSVPTLPDENTPAGPAELQQAREPHGSQPDDDDNRGNTLNRLESTSEAEADDADGNRAEPVTENNGARAPRPRGRRRRGRGGDRTDRGDRGERNPAPPVERAAAAASDAILSSVPPVAAIPLAGDGDEINPAAMPESALSREFLERGRRAAKQTELAQSDKLHKVLADAGIGSRRDMEEMIIAGRVSVNGEPAHIGQRILASDQVRVNGKPLTRKAPGRAPRVLLYHKPVGEIVTQEDPGARPTVFEKLPKVSGSRWVAVGRLDLNSEGLLLFTTSGELANRLMHPRYEVEREYAARVLGELTDELRQKLLDGVQLQDGAAKFLRIDDAGGDGANRWYRVVIGEGRNREVRRIFESVGLTVSRLIRIRYGAIQLPRALVHSRYQELAPEWVQAWVHDLGIGIEDIRQRQGAPPDGGKSGRGGAPRAGGRGPGGRGSGGRDQASRGPGGKGPPNRDRWNPAGRTSGQESGQGYNQGNSFNPGNGQGNGPPAGGPNPGSGGQRRGKPMGNRPPRQPDPLTSSVNYIAAGHGLPNNGRPARFKRGKPPPRSF